jgi:hypothetical protein
LNDRDTAVVIAALCAAAHYQEYVDTLQPLDLGAAKDSIRLNPLVTEWIEENEIMLPLRRDGKTFLESIL